MRLGVAEIDVLKRLARNEVARVSSPQRLRLELLGLAIDSAAGLKLTEAGMNAALNMLPTPHEDYDMPPRRLDAAGRRRMHGRVMPGT
jgi:hypothetical protein